MSNTKLHPVRAASGGVVHRTISIAYDSGPRYPHLERIPGKPDVLDEVIAPRRKM